MCLNSKICKRLSQINKYEYVHPLVGRGSVTQLQVDEVFYYLLIGDKLFFYNLAVQGLK